VKDRRRALGLPVEEFDDLSEEEAALTQQDLMRNMGVPPPVRGQERFFSSQDDRNLYYLCDNVEDLMQTHIFDTR